MKNFFNFKLFALITVFLLSFFCSNNVFAESNYLNNNKLLQYVNKGNNYYPSTGENQSYSGEGMKFNFLSPTTFNSLSFMVGAKLAAVDAKINVYNNNCQLIYSSATSTINSYLQPQPTQYQLIFFDFDQDITLTGTTTFDIFATGQILWQYFTDSGYKWPYSTLTTGNGSCNDVSSVRRASFDIWLKTDLPDTPISTSTCEIATTTNDIEFITGTITTGGTISNISYRIPFILFLYIVIIFGFVLTVMAMFFKYYGQYSKKKNRWG